MAYLHEIALKKAIQKLYMLGRSDARKDQTELNEGLGSAGFALGRILGRPGAAPPDPNRHGTYQERLPVSAKAGVGNTAVHDWLANYRREEHISNEEPPIVTWGTKTAQDLKNQEALENMPIGGRYTPGGLQKAESEAEKNASDRMTLKQIGLGPTGQNHTVGLGGMPAPTMGRY